MDFSELAKKRYSLRSFSTKKIEDEKLLAVIDAANMAPTAVNFQPFRLYIIKSDEYLSKIRECYHREWFKTAPVVLVAVGLHNNGWKRGSDGKDHTDIDVSIVVDHITLQAADLGLGTCWVCNFDAKKCAELLQLHPTEEPIALIPIGYPENDTILEKKRKPVNDITVWL
jgi:nitroreductase